MRCLSWPFGDIPHHHFGAIYADPPWAFDTWGTQEKANTDVRRHYRTMDTDALTALPVESLANKDCVLIMWVTWPTLQRALSVIAAWGFTYKTCAFSWMKANAKQLEFFQEDTKALIGSGYWTRSNSEVCLLAARGKPKRRSAAVRQGIIEPRRQHSRKPDCIYGRIERLVAGPYLELFARNTRQGWTSWGNDTEKFGEVAA